MISDQKLLTSCYLYLGDNLSVSRNVAVKILCRR